MSKTIKVRSVQDPVEVMRYEPGKRALKVAEFLVAQGAHRVDLALHKATGDFVITGPVGDPFPADSYLGYGNPLNDERRGDRIFAVRKESLSGWVNPKDGIEAMVSAPRPDRGFEEVI